MGKGSALKRPRPPGGVEAEQWDEEVDAVFSTSRS
jgi:hypothetical protein